MNKHRKAWGIGLAAAMTVTGAVVLPTVYAQSADAAQTVRQDFNGDGYEDLAVAAQFGTVNGKIQAGYVAVLYGSASGLKTSAKKVYSQASPGVPGSPEERDSFGYALKTADLDGDGFTDLLVESHGEKWQYGGSERRTSHTVLWGGASGFVSGKVLPAVGGDGSQDGEIATGDFNGDGHQDLLRHGQVEFGPFGRDGSPASVQDAVLGGTGERVNDLAAGDVDGDGATDLVVRVEANEENEEEPSHLYLHYVRGSSEGLQPFTVLKDAQGSPVDHSGATLALGDLDGDGRADLVDGYQSLRISYGTANGPDTTATQVIDQDTPGVPGTQEAEDDFGFGLTIGDVDGDGYGDILAGNPTEGVGSVQPTGTFAVVPGGPDGPTGAGTKVFSQNSADVPGTAEKGDVFGGSFDLVDGNGDGRAEPVVGAYGENSGDGAVWVFRSTSAGVTAKGSFVFGARALGTVVDGGWLGRVFPN